MHSFLPTAVYLFSMLNSKIRMQEFCCFKIYEKKILLKYELKITFNILATSRKTFAAAPSAGVK
jgi:hypothetical protein